MVWSGVAGPTVESAAASFEQANSRTSGASSKAMTTRRSRPTSPRSAGATASATRRLSSGDAAATAAPPKRARPFTRCSMASSARLISSIVERYASLTVAPQQMVPCFSSRSALAFGWRSKVSATSREIRKPGRL